MRVLLATTANNGHFGPMLPFAGACRRAGHEVLVAAPESFAGAVERAGHRHWPCPDVDPDEWAALHAKFLAAEPDKRNETMVTLGAELAARSIMPGMLAAIDGWRPDVILREIGELGSAIAGELRGVPCVQMLMAEEIGAAVRSVLTETSYREAADAIATEIAALPPVDEAVGFLAQLTENAR